MNDYSSKFFGQALKELRTSRGYSQEELAEESELDRTYISMLERGIKNPTLHTIIKVSNTLKVPADFLVSRAQHFSKKPSPKKMVLDNEIELPLYGTAISCGKPVGNDHFIEKELSLDKLLMKNPAQTFFVRSVGESMSPVIMDGDYLVIDKALTPKVGQIVLAQIENEFTIKRYFKQSKRMILKADNPLYKDIEVGDDQEALICGVVVSIVRANP